METKCYFITWTTYGTWLPGDARGWRRKGHGYQLPKPLLERWSREQMTGETVLLRPHDRLTTEEACRKHCEHRGWHLFAGSARTNHVHIVVAADTSGLKVRDQIKANCTSALRAQVEPLYVKRTWTRNGDVEILDTDEDIEACILYVTESQDRKGLEYL